jgi:hypothetical protein
MKKEQAIEAVKELPEEFELDELLEKLVVTKKVTQALKQLKNGNTVPHAEVKEMVKQW